MVGATTMTMDARTEVFARIAAALADIQESDALVVGQASRAPASISAATESRLTSATSDRSLFDRFAAELAAVGGRALFVSDVASAVADLIASTGGVVAVQSTASARAASSAIPQDRQLDASSASVEEIERAAFSILEAESLIAETGSAIVHVATRGERMLPYLPPACIIIARTTVLRECLDGAALTGDTSQRGERAIISGPSRTADIEKTIVLGAHGPANLTVVVFDT
jgi:L-lactate dehydrogenase complex protein LldG